MFAVFNIWTSFTRIGFENVFLCLAIVRKTIIFMQFPMFKSSVPGYAVLTKSIKNCSVIRIDTLNLSEKK